MKKKIWIHSSTTQDTLFLLTQQSFIEVVKSDSIRDHIAEIHGAIVRSNQILDRETLSKAKKLQVLITATSGFDHIDLPAAASFGITVMHTPDAHILSASQITWSLILSGAHLLPWAQSKMKSGQWKNHLPRSLELAHKTLGIVGLGRIGQKVAEISQAFNMDVIAFDPYTEDESFNGQKIKRCSYEEVLKQSDVLTFHVPLTRETTNMLAASQLEYINRGALVVNASRGSVLNEADCLQALNSGWLHALALDVFAKEPLKPDSPLLNHPRVITSPHMGSYTIEAQQRSGEQAVSKLLGFFTDGSTSDTLPPKAAWYHKPLSANFLD